MVNHKEYDAYYEQNSIKKKEVPRSEIIETTRAKISEQFDCILERIAEFYNNQQEIAYLYIRKAKLRKVI